MAENADGAVYADAVSEDAALGGMSCPRRAKMVPSGTAG